MPQPHKWHTIEVIKDFKGVTLMVDDDRVSSPAIDEDKFWMRAPGSVAIFADYNNNHAEVRNLFWECEEKENGLEE